MVKGSKPRHSRTTRKPVTIDLEPDDVKEAKSAGKPADKPADGPAGKAASTKAARATGPAVSKPTTAPKDESNSDKVSKPNADAQGASKSAATKSDAPGVKSHTEKPGAAPDGDRSARSGSGMKSFFVGLVAAIVAVALVVGLQFGGVLPVPGTGSNVLSDDVSALKQSMASLEQKLSADGGDAATAFEGRVQALESATGSSSVPAEIEKRIGALENKTTELSSQSSTVAGTAGSADAAALAGVNDKLSALESAQSARQETLQGIEGKITELDNKIIADEASQNKSITAIESRLAAMEKTLDEPRQDIKVARALAAASLKAAIDRGGSFMAELEAFASVDGSSPALEQLRSLAAAGVPSRSTLLTRFPAVASAMIDAGDDTASSAGLFDHLLDSAASLVKVRPVGDISGDSVQAIVARMETRLKNGDLQGAVDEWNTLPQAAKDVSQDYAKDLQARIEAEKLVSSTLTAALPSSDATAAPAEKQDGANSSAQTGEQN